MTEQEILELAAILVREHGTDARRVAESRRAPHLHDPGSESYLLWTKIAAAVEKLLRELQRERADSDCS